MVRKSFLTVLSACFFSLIGQAQSALPVVIPPSPTAMQFQRYGDYPVGHFTGVPEISIPLYTVKDGDIELPISLDYHASGIRVNDVPGLVGLGWALNTGGMVSRTIHDKPDELYQFRIPALTADNIPYWDMSYRDQELTPLVKSYYDHEYDEYSYNFPGKSGKFVLTSINPDGSPGGMPVLYPYKPIKVDCAAGSGGNITDENGITWSFGGGVEYCEYQDPFINNQTRTPPTSWQLGAVRSAKYPSSYVNIEYAPAKVYFQQLVGNQLILDDSWNPTSTYEYWNPDCSFSNDATLQYSAVNGGTTPFQTGSQIAHHTYIPSRLTFSGGSIVFNADPITKTLLSMEVYNIRNERVKLITFDIVPFLSHFPVSNDTKYKLSALHINDNLSNNVATYSFNYENENTADAFPVGGYDVDYWGFYNAAGNTTMLPRYQNFLTLAPPDLPYNITLGNANREASEYAMKTYSLNRITYPTGGYTVFELEANRSTYPDKVVGGLRVKSIKNYAANGQKLTEKNYTYGNAMQELVPDVDLFLNSQYGLSTVGIWFRRSYYSEHPMIDPSPQGSAVVYSSVTESDGNGSISYDYDCSPANTYQELSYPFYPVNVLLPLKFRKFTNYSKPWNYGNLISKTISGSDGTTTEVNEYEEVIRGSARDFYIEPTAFPTTPYSHDACFVGGPDQTPFFNGFYDQYDCYYNFADHYYTSGEKRLKKTTTTQTDVNYRQITIVKNYFYDNADHDQPTRIVTTNSKGEELKTVLTYPADFISSTSPNVYNTMVDRHVWSPVIEQSSFNNNNFLQSTRTNYNYWFNNTWGTFDYYNSIIVPQTAEAKKLSNPWETRVRFDSYDEKGNVKTVFKDGDVKHTYVWGYGKQYPVAEITGADYSTAIGFVNQSVLDDPATTDAQMRTELNKIRTGLAGIKAFVTTYTYKPLIGITSQTDPNNITIYYEYDAAGRLQLIRDKDNNILKMYCYNYLGQNVNCGAEGTGAALWQSTGVTRCQKCALNPNFNTGITEAKEVDNNPSSPTYTQTRWVNIGHTSGCPFMDGWQNTAAPVRCETISGQNTGRREQEQVNVNPCYYWYGYTRWIFADVNTTACPLPAFYTCDDLSGDYPRTNCTAPDVGGSVYVPIPAGMFTSSISVDDANQQAMAYGFNYANEHADCITPPLMLQIDNQTSDWGYDIYLTNTANTSITYTFNFYGLGLHDLSVIEPGNYDIYIAPAAGSNNHYYQAVCGDVVIWGSSVSLNNVPITHACNKITVY